MKYTAYITAFLLGAATAQTSTYDVGSVISDHFSEAPTLAPAVSTTLASALYALQTSWLDSPEFSSLQDAIYSAAATGADQSVQESISEKGWTYDSLITASWFKDGVASSLQSDLTSYASTLSAVAESITAEATTTSSTPTASGNAAMRTPPPIAVAGILGVVGGVLAAM